MTHSSAAISSPASQGGLLAPPPWVGELLERDGGPTPRRMSITSPIRVLQTPRWMLLSAKTEMDDPVVPSLREVVVDAYNTMRSMVEERSGFRPVRVWNVIPRIHRRLARGLDHYMIFNEARFHVFDDWFGGTGGGGFRHDLPTASAVGGPGDGLAIHMLATDLPSRPIENPRQVAAPRYSRRYGPRPPCFARATLLEQSDDRRTVLVGGTASVLGEHSAHPGDLQLQTRETFRNLAELPRAACHGNGRSARPLAADADAWLSRFTELRVYHPRAADRPALERLVREQFPQPLRVEWLHADLCRTDLLVEIEGVAVPRNDE